MRLNNVTRWQASGIHLLISVAIAAIALALMLLVWYPHPLFVAAGGNELLLLLVGVDVIIGPLLTLIVFRQGKKSLRFDLAVIGTLQLAALLYGTGIVYLARPAFIVFVKDRFEVATAVELHPRNLAEAEDPRYSRVPVLGPEWVFAEFPESVEERQRLLQLNFSGFDMQHFPRYFRPYESKVKEVLAKAQPVERVRRTDPKAAKVVDAWLAESGTPEESVRYLELRAPLYWVCVLLDAKTGERRKMLICEKI